MANRKKYTNDELDRILAAMNSYNAAFGAPPIERMHGVTLAQRIRALFRRIRKAVR